MDQSRSVAGAAAMLTGCVFVVSSAFAGESDAQVRTQDIKFQDLNLDTLLAWRRSTSAFIRLQNACALSPENRPSVLPYG